MARAQLISGRKMSNFTVVFGKKCQISRKFHGRLFVVLRTSQNHLRALIHKDYLRYLKAINVKNVTNGHFAVH